MGYTKIGFKEVPRTTMLIGAATTLIQKWGEDLDKEVSKAFRSLARSDAERATNLFFERLLSAEHDSFADKDVRQAFLLIASHFLKETGYISTAPTCIDYRLNSALSVDEVVTLMLATRAPKFSSADVNNEFATLSTIASFLPEVVRRYALIERERTLLTERFYHWIGTIGYKLLRGNTALTQVERTALVMYGDTMPGLLGHSSYVGRSVIKPTEMTEPLVHEAGALYSAATLPGPWYNHQQFVSDTNYERLTAWLGFTAPEVSAHRGQAQRYGPFISFKLEPSDAIPWTINDQLAAITGTIGYLFAARPGNEYYAVRTPFVESMAYDNSGRAGFFRDDPELKLSLIDENNAANFDIEYHSSVKNRTLSSRVATDIPELHLIEKLLATKSGGSMQVEHYSLADFNDQLVYFTPAAAAKRQIHTGAGIKEVFLLPTAKTGLHEQELDVTAISTRFGNFETISAFSEFAEFPMGAFIRPAPHVVEYVAATYGLTLDEIQRFAPVISLYHNVSTYERLTKRTAPVNKRKLAEVFLRGQ